VENSSKVIGGAEAELAGVILMDLMDSAYENIKQGRAVDWNQFLEEVKKYGYEADQEWIDDIQRDLKEDIEVNEQFFQGLKKQESRRIILRSLSVEFHKYMSDKKQVSFICSQGIWENVLHFLIDYRELKKKQLAHPHSIFGFSQKELDRFLGQQIGSLFSFAQAQGFAALWGIPYLYDFLGAKEIIDPKIHQQALTSVKKLKEELMEGFPELWKYDFVHRWSPPDSISPADWEAEVQKFAASKEEVKSLSDEPQSSTRELFLSQLDSFLEQQESSDSKSTETETAVSSPPVKFSKPRKKKKSPLMEAAKLSEPKPKKLPKKRKKS
jgi:hypothetical protein